MARKKDEMIKVKLVKSLIGVPEKQKRVVKALGLRKLNKVRVHKNTPSINGMISKVSHLIHVEGDKK